MTRSPWLPLLVILLIAGALRYPGIDWGWSQHGGVREFSPYHPDEQRFVTMARGLCGERDYQHGYVMGFPHLLSLVYRGMKCAGGSPDDAELLRVARWLSLAAGVGLCGLLFFFARDLFASSRAGLTAAALTATSTLAVIQSHYGTADMTYVLAVTATAWCLYRASSRGSLRWLLLATVCAGAAASIKFGVILLPSLALAAWHQPRRRAAFAVLVPVFVFVFLFAQGFALRGNDLVMMWNSFSMDNAGGYDHNRWLNAPLYAMVLLRGTGLIIFILACHGAIVALRKGALRASPRLIAFLPYAIHAAGLMLMVATFPRHATLLVPVVVLLATYGIEQVGRRRDFVCTLAIGWAAALALVDAAAFRGDARDRAADWLQQELPGGVPVWCDLFAVHTPLSATWKRVGFDDAVVVIVHEQWLMRFVRSEINPAGPPASRRLYHASIDDVAWYDRLQAEIKSGQLVEVYQDGPPLRMPEQFVYAALWGDFEKFAGSCLVLARTESYLPKPGTTGAAPF